MTPAALYHRVSTVDQNPRAARRELRGATKRLGLRVVLDVEERGSGANNDGPGLVKVLEAARQRGSKESGQTPVKMRVCAHQSGPVIYEPFSQAGTVPAV